MRKKLKKTKSTSCDLNRKRVRMFSKCIWSVEKQINSSAEDKNRLWKLIKNYERVEECEKKKLAYMLRLIKIIIDGLERSRI